MRWSVALLLVAGFAGCMDDAPRTDAAPEPVVAGVSAILHDTILRDRLAAESTIDGVQLVVDVFRPDTDDPVPVILVQSPYWSFLQDAKASDRPTWYIDYFVPRGYAVALGEMRGTRDSGGCWDFGGRLDQQDGHDMVEFLAAQPWSNGHVGMLGQSHVGMSQVAAAVTAPPSLKTIVPIAAVTDWYRYLHYEGAPYVTNRATPPAYFAVHASPSDPPTGGEGTTPAWVLTQAQTACVDNVVHLSQSAQLDGDKDAYWHERDLIAKAGGTQASVFLVHGFLDENVKTDHFLDYWDALPEDLPKKAWYGQWFHEHPSFVEWREDLHRWYDFWLKGIQNGIMDEPRITVQDNQGHNRTEHDWPGAVAWTPLALDEDRLNFGDPQGDSARRNYLATPGDDRGTLPLFDPGYASSIGLKTQPLDAPLRIAGEARLNLSASLSAPDGRWIAALFDVAPNGTRDEISRAYLDARHRGGPSSNDVVEPLATIDYTLTFYPRDHVVPAGHRIELALLGGDMGCTTSDDRSGDGYAGTCEGTGIVPLAHPVIHIVDLGAGGSTLWLPVVPEAGPERTLTPLDGWLNDLPE